MLSQKERDELRENGLRMKVEDLRREIAGAIAGAEVGVERACVLILALEERGEPLPDRLPGVFAHFRKIARGELSAGAAWRIQGITGAIEAIAKLKPQDQDLIASGHKVKVATRENGRISSLDLSIDAMSGTQMDLAFSAEKGIRPLEDQQKILFTAPSRSHDSTSKVKPSLRASKETGEIIVNRTHVSVDDLADVLATMGYMLKAIPRPKHRALAMAAE